MAYVIWLTGISGAGKTTLGQLVQDALHKRHGAVEFIDGDSVRDFFENDLGYSRAERILNVKRIAFAAMLVARHGTHVVVANIAPYYEVRDFIRKHIRDYIQVYVKASPEKVMERDVKGHYARLASGATSNIIGFDDMYDIPRHPDVIVDTDRESVEQSLAGILDYLAARGVT